MRYKLEIYEPKSHDTTLGNYEADTPFMRIDVGDIIEPRFLNGVLWTAIGWQARADREHLRVIFTRTVTESGA